MAEKQGVNVLAMMSVGAIGAVLLVVILIAAHALYLWQERKEVARKQDKPLFVTPEVQTAELKAQQLRAINTPRWMDDARTVAAIPIERAMKEVARAGGRPAMAPSPATRPAGP